MDGQSVRDFLWLDRREAGQLFADQKTKKYWRSISSSLFHEQIPDHIIKRIISRVTAGSAPHADRRGTAAAST